MVNRTESKDDVVGKNPDHQRMRIFSSRCDLEGISDVSSNGPNSRKEKNKVTFLIYYFKEAQNQHSVMK